MLLLITECSLFLEWTLIYYDRAFALAAPEDVALNPYDSHIQVKNMLLFIFAVLSFLFSLTFSPEGKHSVSLIQCSSNFPSFSLLLYCLREGVYTSSPFLVAHLLFNPSQPGFCSYNISKSSKINKWSANYCFQWFL